jgi:UDP-glucose 4-epimerase
VVESPRRAGDPAVLVASSDLIRRRLGWVPLKPRLEDMVGDAWEFMRRPSLAAAAASPPSSS